MIQSFATFHAQSRGSPKLSGQALEYIETYISQALRKPDRPPMLTNDNVQRNADTLSEISGAPSLARQDSAMRAPEANHQSERVRDRRELMPW